MALIDFNEIESIRGSCVHYDLANATIDNIYNSVLHFNVRSLCRKVDEIQAFLSKIGYHKVVLLTDV